MAYVAYGMHNRGLACVDDELNRMEHTLSGSLLFEDVCNLGTCAVLPFNWAAAYCLTACVACACHLGSLQAMMSDAVEDTHAARVLLQLLHPNQSRYVTPAGLAMMILPQRTVKSTGKIVTDIEGDEVRDAHTHSHATPSPSVPCTASVGAPLLAQTHAQIC